MTVWLVTPAWGRVPVTRVALAQRAWLRDELAPHGVELRSVVIADDGNLDVAREHGFDTIELDNRLGERVNRGFEYAWKAGAEWAAFVGSDDWLLPELFDGLPSAGVVGGRTLAQVDVAAGKLRVVGCTGKYGGIPWFIHRGALCKNPVPPGQMSGIDLHLSLRLRRARWELRANHPLAAVDFKTDNNLTPYGAGRSLGEAPAWEALRSRYPDELVDMAEDLQMAVAR